MLPNNSSFIDIKYTIPPYYLHFVVVVGLVWSCDPESYAGGSFATRRISHAGQVKGDGSD
jgi:hypothetical protein